MNRRSVGLAAFVGAIAALGSRPAAAQGSGCPRLAVEAGPSVTARWPDLVDHVRQSFEARDDTDRCAHVVLTSRGATITVHVALPDGRSTARRALGPDDVVPMLQALLLIPDATDVPSPVETSEAQPPSSPEPESPASVPVRVAVVAAVPVGSAVNVSVAVAPHAPNHDATPPSSSGSSRVRIELSAVTGARVGDGQWSVGAGALSFLDVSGWLIGFAGRADRYRTIASGPTDGAALELAAPFGRRLRLRSIAFDLFMGPAVADQGTASFTSTSAAPPMSRSGQPGTGGITSASSTSVVPRLLVGARVNFGALALFRTFVGVDGDFGEARAGGNLVPGAPRLPVWSLGLALGATVGTR